MGDLARAIQDFIGTAREPQLVEAGEAPFALEAGRYAVTERAGGALVEAWDERRSIARRVTAITQATRAKLALRTERFGKRVGELMLVDAATQVREVQVQAGRLELRERLRRFLKRTFPDFAIPELTAGADLHHSLSPAYPRAFIRRGREAWAAMAASNETGNADGVLTFGLIWLDYLRAREPALAFRGLVLLLPEGAQRAVCLRLRWLDPGAAQYRAFVYAEDGFACEADLRDYGNLETHIEPCTGVTPALQSVVKRIAALPDVEAIPRAGGVSLRVRGLEFARAHGNTLITGIDRRQVTNGVTEASNVAELECLARELARVRHPDTRDRLHPLFARGRELWLESAVRRSLTEIDANLLVQPVYGEAPAIAGLERGAVDLLAAARDGRLAVLELKTSEDIHLPMQALDYWIRVRWHLQNGDFERGGYFPGLQLRSDPPRMILVAPALEYHPSTERLLRFFPPEIEVVRIGLAAAWQRELKILFRT